MMCFRRKGGYMPPFCVMIRVLKGNGIRFKGGAWYGKYNI